MFLTLYLQLLGMSDGAASALMALFLGGRHACIFLLYPLAERTGYADCAGAGAAACRPWATMPAGICHRGSHSDIAAC